MSDGDRSDAADSDTNGDRLHRSIEPSGLKDVLGGADDTNVLDGPAGIPRLTWDAVTDAGGAPVQTHPDARAASSDESSFQFDLGGALARLVGGSPPSDADAPASPPDEATTPPAVPPSHQAIPPVAEPSVARPTPFMAPSSPPPPSPSPVTRPIEPMAYQPVVQEPSAPATPPAPPPVPEAPSVQQEPSEYPRRVPGTHLESQLRPGPADVTEIKEATPVDAPPRPAVSSSVFDDLHTPVAPTLPTTSPGRPTHDVPAAAPQPTSSPTLPSAAASAPAAAPSVPAPSPASPGSFMPSLPASNPAAPPPVAEPARTAPSTPDINALRSAQLRANKQQRQGRMLGRTLLAFVVIGGLIAGALVFGRSLLFDTEWDAQLTPLVNEIEAERGAFDHTVPIVIVPAAELGDRLRAATIGDAWVEQVPEWRALGVAAGPVDAASVGAALASSTTAVYDPTEDQIYQLEGIDPADGAADLRVALERAFDAQQADAESGAVSEADAADSVAQPAVGDGLTGVSTLETIATKAVDRALASGGTVGVRDPADESLPLPIAYELAAIDVLGEPILTAIGLDPVTHVAGEPYPESITAVLDDGPEVAAAGIIQPGDISLATPRALGTDDWSLVWGARLPAPTVDLLVDRVSADSYRPVSRADTTCFIAVFETADEAAGNSVFASMLTWAANAPVASQAVATSVGPNRVQLEACDPGAEASPPPNAGVVDDLLDRQQLRLTN